VDEVDLPHFANALAVYYIVMPAEVSSNLARLDGIRYGTRLEGKGVHDVYKATRGALFGKEVRRRILLGTYVLSHGYYDAYYNKAVAVRQIIRKELEKVLESYDAVITPTTPTPAFKIGEKANDPVAMYLADLFTVPGNIAQHPAISVPSGKNSEGLPFGIQCFPDFKQ
jgi:aspartyl-tRNA(Asn)/glutamyl-tRNA(Gln) amidotransferase subunit A